jgi:hypothetical protein
MEERKTGDAAQEGLPQFEPDRITSGFANAVSVSVNQDNLVMDFYVEHPPALSKGDQTKQHVFRAFVPLTVAARLSYILKDHIGKFVTAEKKEEGAPA